MSRVEEKKQTLFAALQVELKFREKLCSESDDSVRLLLTRVRGGREVLCNKESACVVLCLGRSLLGE